MSTIPFYQLEAFALLVMFCTLMWFKKLPPVESLQNLATLVNTKGGNILVLAGFSLVFFFTSLGLIYWALNRMAEGKLSADNAVLMMALSWLLGTAFGGSFSSMLKVMTGEETQVPPPKTIEKKTETTTVSTVVAGEPK